MVHIATSCQGMMTEHQVSLKPDEIAMMTFEDPESAFGTVSAPIDTLINDSDLDPTLLVHNFFVLNPGRVGW